VALELGEGNGGLRVTILMRS